MVNICHVPHILEYMGTHGICGRVSWSVTCPDQWLVLISELKRQCLRVQMHPVLILGSPVFISIMHTSPHSWHIMYSYTIWSKNDGIIFQCVILVYLYSCSSVLSDLTPLLNKPWSSLVLMVRSSCVISERMKRGGEGEEEREKTGRKKKKELNGIIEVSEGLTDRRANLVISIVFFIVIHTCNIQNYSLGARTKPIGQELLCLEQNS